MKLYDCEQDKKNIRDGIAKKHQEFDEVEVRKEENDDILAEKKKGARRN